VWQAPWEKLSTMEQRLKDMEVAVSLGAPDAATKSAFCRQKSARGPNPSMSFTTRRDR
jgi:hypothetical protein